MKSLVELIVKSLVDFPDQVKVEEIQHGKRVTLSLSVAKEDMGRVIGRGGKVANAIRTLLRAAGEQDECQVNLEVLEP